MFSRPQLFPKQLSFAVNIVKQYNSNSLMTIKKTKINILFRSGFSTIVSL